MIETLTGQRSQVSAVYWLAPSVEGKELFIGVASLIIFGSAR